MDRIGRFEFSKKHFTQRFRMSVAPNPSSPVPRYTPQLPHPSVGGRSRRGWQGRHRGRRSCILRSRSGRGAFSSPASRRGGYVHPVHSAGTLSLPILSRDVPDRWNWAGSRSLICIHGTRSRRALPAGWRQQSHSRRLLQTPDFPVESGLRFTTFLGLSSSYIPQVKSIIPPILAYSKPCSKSSLLLFT